ncbi:unnamed protein product [Psylliodes chrysocephalus]|uniref:Carboxylesterase type B domain-containing protein n=1 Tax=Psylliodes chrysocephalus TaxID=3402493 RepID=A0A9P0CKZ8_9CUCU|nr:unnamed protein product [Psylliodes chrysocephala]
MSAIEMDTIKTKVKTNEDNTKISTCDNSIIDRTKPSKVSEYINRINTYKVPIGASLCFSLAIIIIIVISIMGHKEVMIASEDGSKVFAHTSCGRVEGLMEDSSFTFRGIPFARPPIGELRFRFAQPLDRIQYCWNGTFIAHNDSGLCLQILANGTTVGKEDCLTLDVVTPYVRYDNPLPVIVLIGSETLMGGSPGKLRPSARYARSRDVVFVRPNFRLGALGFLSLDILAESDYPKTSGNYGLSDIVAALNWVQLNIEHFGGNKHAVTVFGHRAGATLVTALTAIQGAGKYFVRAWASSGSAVYPKRDARQQQSDNRSFLDAVRCENVECLRDMDAEMLVKAVEDTWRKPFLDLPLADEKPQDRHQWLVVDGRLLKSYTEEIWNPDTDLPVNLIIGTTAHSSSSEKLLMKHKHWTEELVKQHIQQSVVSSTGEGVFTMYDLNYEGLSRMISDIRIVCPLLDLSRRLKSVPFYVVTQTRFAECVADVDSDVDAILGRYEPRTPEQRRYFSAMQGLFYHYVWDGNIEQNMIGQRALIVGQDVLPNSSYSWCDYWTLKNVVPKYAVLD